MLGKFKNTPMKGTKILNSRKWLYEATSQRFLKAVLTLVF